MANRPYEFGLTSEYNKYTLERPNMEGALMKTAQPRSYLSLKSQATGT